MIHKILKLLKSKYIFYGLSTVFGRGLEYLMLLFVAATISKDDYGEFEFYKKTIELLAIFISFGTPTLLLTYTKSTNSKINLTLVSFLISILLILIISPFFYYFNFTILLLPTLFFALFFYSNSIAQSFNLIEKGSNYSAIYKIIGSVFFNVLIVLFIFNSEDKSKSLIRASNICLILFGGYYALVFLKYARDRFLDNLRKYIKIFVKLIYNSSTLVLNNFVNIAFLYTDIYIINFFANKEYSNQLMADYSFSLNIANALVIIPLTIAQVDIEKVKKNNSVFKDVLKKNLNTLMLSVSLLIILYFVIISFVFEDYKETKFLFILIIIAKFIQALTIPYGMMILIKKRFNFNLIINLVVFVLNILISVLLFYNYGLFGLALASSFLLLLRYVLIRRKVNEIIENNI